MKKTTKSIRDTVLRFVGVHFLIVGLFAGMAYLTVKLLIIPTSWPAIMF